MQKEQMSVFVCLSHILPPCFALLFRLSASPVSFFYSLQVSSVRLTLSPSVSLPLYDY